MTTEKNALINAIINLCTTEEDMDLLDLVYKVLISNREEVT